MTVAVVDASVAIKWFVVENDSPVAERLLLGPGELHAPDLLRTEVANALWNNHRRGFIGESQALMAADSVGQTIARWHRTDTLVPQALDLAMRHSHPVYDFVYLVLAQRLDLPLITADMRFARAAARTDLTRHVVPLAEWTAP